MGSRCMIDGGRTMFISGEALWFKLQTYGPIRWPVAARVINGTLLAVRGTCFRSDTDTEKYVAYNLMHEF